MGVKKGRFTMIIPKFIYEEIVKMKEEEAYNNGERHAIENIRFSWLMVYGDGNNVHLSPKDVLDFFDNLLDRNRGKR